MGMVGCWQIQDQKKEMEKPGPLGGQAGGFWAGWRSCDMWESQHLWQAVSVQPHNHYDCPADRGACTLAQCGVCLFVELGWLGIILPFLQVSEVEKVCNLGKYQLCLVRVNGLIVVESHLQALSMWILQWITASHRVNLMHYRTSWLVSSVKKGDVNNSICSYESCYSV